MLCMRVVASRGWIGRGRRGIAIAFLVADCRAGCASGRVPGNGRVAAYAGAGLGIRVETRGRLRAVKSDNSITAVRVVYHAVFMHDVKVIIVMAHIAVYMLALHMLPVFSGCCGVSGLEDR